VAVGATDTMAEAAGVTVVVAGAAVEGTMAMRATPDAAILDAAMPVMASTAEQAEASMVVAADSMAAVASTAAVVMAAAADTDNRS
jgi:CheY-like chemotaxis protein